MEPFVVLLIFLLIIGGIGLGLYLMVPKPKCPENCEKCDGDKCKVCKKGFGININKKPNAKGECKVECPDKCADSVCQYDICTKCQPGYGINLKGDAVNNTCPPYWLQYLNTDSDSPYLDIKNGLDKDQCISACTNTKGCIFAVTDGTSCWLKDNWGGFPPSDKTLLAPVGTKLPK